MNRFNLFLLSSIILITSCKKDNDEPIGFDPSTCSTYIFQSSNIPGSRLIIQLNASRMIDSISYYYTSMNNTPTSTQKFFYSGSNKIDSTIIDGIINHKHQTIIETYDYNASGFIKTIFRDVTANGFFGTTYRKDTIGFDRDSKYRVYKITTTSTSETGKSISYKEFEYNEKDNLTKAIYSSPTDTIVFPNNYENFFEEYDNKINPLYKLSTMCNYPIYISSYWFFTSEYSLSKNNLIKMISLADTEPKEITQSYSYNYYNYPIKVTSTEHSFNIDIFYANQ